MLTLVLPASGAKSKSVYSSAPTPSPQSKQPFSAPCFSEQYFSAFDNYFLQAQRIRQLVRDDFNRVFRVPNVLSSATEGNNDGVDVLLHPSVMRTAPKLGAIDATSLETYLQDVLTVPASFAGLPALSVPIRSSDSSWPVGVSVVGQWGCDEMVLRVGKFIEAQ
jgi:aspartyl-tRNA(Asn)/glutamyl-tRNA(Gln) amidotransferase subunit A